MNPFGALDHYARTYQDDYYGVQRDVHKTILFVSHDIEEAFKLGDQIAVLSEGKLVQAWLTVELLARPAMLLCASWSEPIAFCASFNIYP